MRDETKAASAFKTDSNSKLRDSFKKHAGFLSKSRVLDTAEGIVTELPISRNVTAQITNSIRPQSGAKVNFVNNFLNIDNYLNIEDQKDISESEKIEDVDQTYFNKDSDSTDKSDVPKSVNGMQLSDIKKICDSIFDYLHNPLSNK